MVAVDQVVLDGGGSGWHAGDGGDGKSLTVNIDNPDSVASLRVYVGGGGKKGVIELVVKDRLTGFAVGGNGGNGTGGGGGGGGGLASAVGTSVKCPGSWWWRWRWVQVDATQGNDQNGQPSPNDGAQNLGAIFSGSGGTGQNSVCTGGGGGGGGGGVGFWSGIGGGGGAGNGSNARREGYGAQRGRSAFKGSGSGGTATLISAGDANNGAVVGLGQQISGGAGSVDFTATENQTFYGGGGGGGSGSYFYFKFEATDINAGTMVIGEGGDQSGDSGQGNISYQVTETISGGTTTSTTSGLINSASTSVDYVQSGTGTGVNGGFASIDSEKYLRFFGNEAIRWARSIPIDATDSNSKASEINTVKIRVIRGNDSNGGEKPNEPLELFASNDNATSFTKNWYNILC